MKLYFIQFEYNFQLRQFIFPKIFSARFARSQFQIKIRILFRYHIILNVNYVCAELCGAISIANYINSFAVTI